MISTAKELGVAVIAYSPLGKGFLAKPISVSDLPPGDQRNWFPRFQEDVSAIHLYTEFNNLTLFQ